MRKAFYSIIIIIYSIFTITVINYFSNDSILNNSEAFKNEKNSVLEENEIERGNDAAAEEEEAEYEEKVKENNEDSDKAESDSAQDNVTESNKEKNRTANKKVIYESSEYDTSENEENIEAKIIEREEPVLKVPAKEIPSKMPLDDKLRLLAYTKKLSKEDYGKIIDYIKNYDARGAIEGTFSILDNKLSDNEIEEIKGILSDYINFESL